MGSAMKTIYTAHAVTVAGREGRAETDDKQLSVQLSKPGSGKPGTNPEQLFAAGYGACFGGAVEAVAKKQQVTIDKITVRADVSLNQDESQGYFIAVVLDVALEGPDAATAKKIVEAAHQLCPYSKATRGNVDVRLKVNDKPLAAAA
jgi:osmotically inducible protein OsmC